MAVLLKTASVRVSSIQIMQVRVQNKAKVFGKVDTMETYHLHLCFAVLERASEIPSCYVIL